MAFDYPDDLTYTDTHEYARVEGNRVTVGITMFAIDQLGDIVFLELPNQGETVNQGEKFGTVESVKAVEDLKSPVTGTVVAINDALIETPEALAEDPYGAAWLIKVELAEGEELTGTMTASDYRSLIGA